MHTETHSFIFTTNFDFLNRAHHLLNLSTSPERRTACFLRRIRHLYLCRKGTTVVAEVE